MVLNDFKVDLEVLCKEKGMTRADLARDMGISRQLLAKYAAKAGMTEAYTRALEELGYDIIVEYKRRV